MPGTTPPLPSATWSSDMEFPPGWNIRGASVSPTPRSSWPGIPDAAGIMPARSWRMCIPGWLVFCCGKEYIVITNGIWCISVAISWPHPPLACAVLQAAVIQDSWCRDACGDV